jgi:hypothetical protein
MRLVGCVADERKVSGKDRRVGARSREGLKRNAEGVLRVCLSTGWFAIPETIDARRGIEEV